jgi:hypothetical protein
MNMDYRAFENIVRETVADYTNRAAMDDIVSPNEVYIVWSCKTLQNWKALAATSLPDGLYFEITYNGDKDELYLDAYRKEANEVTKL